MNKDSNIKEAGRGFVLITGAKLWFLITATFTSLAFPRLFGDPVLFGQFRVVSGLLNVVTMVVITASVQAVSKLASESGADIRHVRRTAFKGQLLFFGPVFLALFVLSGLIADSFLNDPGISLPLRVSSLVVLAYLFYSALVGLLNGTRNYGRQAGLDILFSTLKTILMVGAVVVSGSVAVAYGAFALTAWIVLAVAAVMVGQVVSACGAPDHSVAGESCSAGVLQKSRPTVGSYLSFLLPLAGYALVLNLLLQADVIGIKAALGSGSDLPGSQSGADNASVIAGIYGAAKNVALLPYQAVISLTFIVFPMVARASSSGDRDGASSVVTGAFRLSAMLSWGAVAVFGAAPREILGLLFGSVYQSGSSELVILLAAGALLAFMYVGNAVLASSGRPVVSMLGGIGAVAVQVGLLLLLLPGATGAQAASGAAYATLAGAVVGAGVAGVLTARSYRNVSWLWTAVSSILSAAAGVAVGGLLDGHVLWVIRPVVSAVVFMIVLVVTRGTGRADLEMVLKVVRRGR